MRLRKYNKSLGQLSLSAGTVSLSGCSPAPLDPKGQIDLEQCSLILTVSGLMSIATIPAILMVVGFAWKYRVSNKDAKYSPNRSYSNKVGVMVWMVPILIIIFLAVLTRKTVHAPEPSKPLAHDGKFIAIKVVSMDQKWFFIHPEQGITTVNEIVFPTNTPMHFKVTPNSVINSFFTPRLGSQIYAVAGVQTRLYLVANEPDTYDGIPASYSGPDSSGMKFRAIITSNRAASDQWVVKAKQSPSSMSDMAVLEELITPSGYNQMEYFSNVKPDLFVDVINKSMVHGKSMDITQPEGEHSVYEGMESMDMSRAESVH